MHENEIGTMIVDSAIHLHQDLGPGLLKPVYGVTVSAKLPKRRSTVTRQVSIAIEYDGQYFAEGFRAALVDKGNVVVELKSPDNIHPAHQKQVLI